MPTITSTKSCTDPMLELGNLHQLYVKGIDALALMDPNENMITTRPWIDEPSGSIPFDEQGGVAVPAVGSESIVLTFPVPSGYDGVVKRLSCNLTFCGFVEFSGDVVWRLEINGKAVRNFSKIQIEKGTIEIPREISPLRLYSGDIIKWWIFHAANAGLVGSTVCSLNGYIYPSKGMS